MVFVATYLDAQGQSHTKKITAYNESEARKQLRRNGIRSADATIEEFDKMAPVEHPAKTQDPGFWQQVNAAAEEQAQREQETKDPNNFHKILTNDDLPRNDMSDVQYEYKHLRLDYKGRGITQELHILDVDGVRVTGWFDGNNVPTLPEIFQVLGNAGWQMIGHQINQDLAQNGITFHYYNFMRIKNANQPDRVFASARQEKGLTSSFIESFGA